MKNSFSIIELLVVMSVVALLVVIAIPSITAMQKSFDAGGAETMISTALATARTLAIKNGHYTGVRFQKAWKPNEDPLKAQQYMIFITYNSDKSDLTCGFIAVDGYKPIKLPDNTGIFDKMVRKYLPVPGSPQTCAFTLVEDYVKIPSELEDIAANIGTDGYNRNITDMSTFSIVFSPSGKLVSNIIRCRNRNGESHGSVNSDDDVFNTPDRMQSVTPKGMFLQDDYDDYGIGVENSRKEFYIYDRQKFEKLPTTGTQRFDYLSDADKVPAIYINPYTGELIKN